MNVRPVVTCVLALAAATTLGAVPARAQSPAATAVPALVLRAVAAFQSDVHGVIGLHRHFTTLIQGGPVKHSEESDSGFIMNDGAFVRIHYYRVADDGRPFTVQQLDQRETQTNRDWSDGKVFFKEPYDRRYVADYRFSEPEACTACPDGTMAVRFTSPIKDSQHGNGTMWIGTATARVYKLTYVPNALPPHATSGTITEIGGEALPDIWYVIRIDESYRGHELVLSGTATFTGIFDRFRRFASLSEAESALQSESI